MSSRVLPCPLERNQEVIFFGAGAAPFIKTLNTKGSQSMSCQNQDEYNTGGQKWWASYLLPLLYQPGHTILRWQWCYPHLSHWERSDSAFTTFLLLISFPRPRLARSKGRELYSSWSTSALTLFLKDGQTQTAQLTAAEPCFCPKREEKPPYIPLSSTTPCPLL